jgi:3-hydroxybutyrate dehydrogenase
MSKEELEKQGAVVVTGGSSGIGAATVRAFCDTHSIVFACDRNPVAQDAQFPPNVRFVQADISSESDVARLAGIVAAAGIPLDVIVNNAGITHIASIETIRIEDWRRVMDVNITGTCLVTRSLLPLLRSPGGVIVNVASDQSVIAKPNRVAYGTSKGAIALNLRPLVLDPDDDIFAELSLAAGADFLVTFNIRDFAPIRQFGIEVVAPAQFRKIIESP